MNDLLEGFFEECEELLEVLSDGVDAMAAGTDDSETINAVFRSVHSIKGGAGAFGMEILVEFSHAFENLLDSMRSGRVDMSPALVPLLYQAADHLNVLVENTAKDQTQPPEIHASLIADLKLACQNSATPAASVAAAPEDEDPVASFEPLTINLDAPLEVADGDDSDDDPRRHYEIRFAPHATLYEHGLEPVLMFRALGELGEISVDADIEGLPALADLGHGHEHVVWTIVLKTEASRTDVEQIFEFTRDLCDLDIIDMDNASRAGVADFAIDPATAPVQPELPLAAASPPEPEVTAERVAEPTIEEPAASTPEPAEAATVASASAGGSKKTGRETLRVELDRVDRLVNIVGELVISEAMLRQSMSDSELSSNSSASNAMVQLKQLSGELQESVMAIRAQPVRGLFQRMSRIVRETARETGKEARLVTEGDATEVDKTVTERLVDPLTHMIRNAVDHGLETPDERAAAGKPRVGRISLSAAHRSGRIQIQLRDDGAGINREKVRATAVRKGLISESDELTDGDTDNLLFMPGFSTNETVSNLSGRGVGMDVVRSEIQALGGRVSISSSRGEGTTFSISLPLTLAVLEGMIVSVAGERLVVPTTSLRETVRVSEASVHFLGQSERVLAMRDGLIPIVDLGQSLGLRASEDTEIDQSLLLIEADSGRRVALAVDQVFDQREVVIKGLEQNYRQIPGIAAATILGDGRIALIVDTDQMIPHGSSVAEQVQREKHVGEFSHA